jgi:hypothetical protein
MNHYTLEEQDQGVTIAMSLMAVLALDFLDKGEYVEDFELALRVTKDLIDFVIQEKNEGNEITEDTMHKAKLLFFPDVE